MLDRFARDLAGGLDTLDGFARNGVELHVVGRGRIEAKSASGFLTTGVELLMTEHCIEVVTQNQAIRVALARVVRIPSDSEHAFRVKPNSESEGWRTPVPTEAEH